MDERIRGKINKIRLWVFFRNIVDYLMWCLPIGAGIGMLFEVIGYFLPWYHVHFFTIGAIGVAVVVALVASIIKFPTAQKAAQEIDKSGLDERVQTAVELIGQDNIFANLQKSDAYRVLVGKKIMQHIPIKMTWKRPAAFCIFMFFLIIFASLPSEARLIANRKYEVAKQAKEEIAKVEEVKEELEEIKELLNDIVSELKDAKTGEEIDKSLERAKTKLEQMSKKTENDKARGKMQELAKSLDMDRSNDSRQSDNNEMLAALESLEEKLSELEKLSDLSELSEEELKELQELLEELEETSAGELSAEQLASLEELANQLGSGQLSKQSLANAQATISGMKASQLASNDNQSQSGDNSGENSGSGDGNNDGNGGNGNGNGNGGNGGGGQGSGNGGAGSGNGHGGGWNYGSKNGIESDESYGGDMVSIPNEMGNDENLTGQATDGTSFISKGGDALTWTGNQVEYSTVYSSYRQKAWSRIQNGGYPSGVQDIIKSYFESIQY